MLGDLTDRATIKAWLDIISDGSDLAIDALISGASRVILGYLSRPLLVQSYANELYDGKDTPRLLLRQWPVLSVSLVSADGAIIPPAVQTPGQVPVPGYLLDRWDGSSPGAPQNLSLMGFFRFREGIGNVQVSYTAGYGVLNEVQTVAGGAATANASFGPWVQDVSVTYQSTGLPLVTTSGAPAAGQYTPPKPYGGAAKYTFNAADNGQVVLISYGFTPQDLVLAAMRTVGEEWRYKDRIGQRSKTLAGKETMAYQLTDLPDAVKLMLRPYRRMIPQ